MGSVTDDNNKNTSISKKDLDLNNEDEKTPSDECDIKNGRVNQFDDSADDEEKFYDCHDDDYFDTNPYNRTRINTDD